ncbi:ABC transporter substrate-binding protein [Pseudonocardia phyllosphaerae]|uniref:ABC transporter substrate-binding protein n=1 Tax=Pseudonocardia phyllosphaerae TaxID=3390502 RepID=UPI00397DE503
MRVGVKVAAITAVTSLALAGCGGGSTQAGADGYPMTIENCGHDVVVDHKPERVVALGPSEVTTITTAGGASKLVGRDDAGLRSAPYPPAMRAATANVPQLGTGGEVTREAIIDARADLVVGKSTETVNPDTLSAVNIPLYALRGNCGSNHAPGTSDGTSDFEDVFSDLTVLGKLFGTEQQASAAIADMKKRIAATKAPASLQGKSAAALIVFKNGLEAYGSQAMSHTQLQTLGLRDVFGDTPKRVFEANIEEIIARNPDVVVLYSYNETPEQAKQNFLRIPGAANLNAVKNKTVLVQPYELSSQGALAVNGLENMAKNLGKPQR